MSANKAKGTAWESALVRTLGEFFGGFPGLRPRRVAQEGFLDTGDLHGLDPFVGQAKNWKSWEAAIREGLDGAVLQAARAGADYGVALVKRARRSVGDGYAVMRVADFARVSLRLARAEYLLSKHAPDQATAHRAATLADVSREFPK